MEKVHVIALMPFVSDEGHVVRGQALDLTPHRAKELAEAGFVQDAAEAAKPEDFRKKSKTK